MFAALAKWALGPTGRVVIATVLCAVAIWLGYEALKAHHVAIGRAEVQAKFDAYKLAQQLLLEEAKSEAREIERKERERYTQLDAEFKKHKGEAKHEADEIVADLAAGNRELQLHWAGCETARLSGEAALAARVDELARLRRESSGRIVQAVLECEAHVRVLQGALSQ
jgi:vacuolar-type H+-ATPase subunit H